MSTYPKAIERLIREFAKLPGIGEKTAGRLAFHIINAPSQDVYGLSEALVAAKKNVRLCPQCYSITDKPVCDICADPERDKETVCVVEDTNDVFAIEKIKEYKGLYHVLHGAISPLEGIGPKDIKARELILRLEKEPIKEVIMATNPKPEGEATAVYLSQLILPAGIVVTRLAKGIPIGSDMEYIDEMTLVKAFEGRKSMGTEQ